MEINAIHKDSQLVNVILAEARGERLDSKIREQADAFAAAIAEDPSPNNLHVLGQLVSYNITEMLKPTSDFLARFADYKTIGEYDSPKFQIELEGIRAYIQTEGSTTPRSRIAHKNITLDDISVSVRPSISRAELKRGSVNIADLSAKATVAMEAKMLQYIRQVLEAGACQGSTLTSSAPYYTEASGVLKANLDPLVRHWMRYGGVGIVGDIEFTSQIAELTGFAANTTTNQYAENIIMEQNQNGYIGRYNGAEVATMMNPYKQESLTETVLNPKLGFVYPLGATAEQRPLKVFMKGAVDSMEATHIDDKSYEFRMDQTFGAGYVYGEQPYLSVYKDLSV